MKNLFTLTLIFMIGYSALAQNKSLGVGIATPNPNAALHVESPTNNQGFIMPRLTTAQRTAMAALLTTTDNGLMLYDTDLSTVYIWDGTVWKTTAQVAGGARLSYPYKDSVTTTLTGNDVFALKYNNAANKRVLRVESLSTTNGSSAVSVLQNGTGLGIFSSINNPTSGTTAIYGTTNSNLGGAVAPVGVYGESTGTGSLAAAFRVNNTASTFPAVYAETNGSGPTINARNIGTTNGFAGLFQNTSATNAFPAIQANSNGTGSAIRAFQGPTNGDGPGIDIFMQKPTSTSSGLVINGNHTGEGVRLNMNTTTSTASGINVNQQGLGTAGNFVVNNPASSSPALNVRTNGLGSAGNFENTITTASANAVTAKIFTNTAGTAVDGLSYGTAGHGGAFWIDNNANNFPALTANTQGTGSAASFSIISGGINSANALFAATNGLGSAAKLEIGNSFNTTPALLASTVGTGSAGNFQIQNATSSAPGLFASTNGTGVGIRSESTGFAAVDGFHNGVLGNGGYFGVNNVTNNRAGLYGYTLGVGAATMGETATGFAGVFGLQTGTSGRAGLFAVDNPANSNDALYASNAGIGGAIRGEILNAASNNAAILGYTNGTGSAAYFNHTGVSGSVATFASSSSNVARIDKTGRGFFNNGTQTGGADVAEMFEVEGARESYEPGDVLVISESTDRTVEKSSSRMSTKVVGVYATKPGVTLTERGIDADLSDMVPMGVIGVIPTKVCNENGPIKRGDLLVTSSKTGHAMKAISEKGDGVFPSGAVIGKALENFEVGETGLIKVLVNVK